MTPIVYGARGSCAARCVRDDNLGCGFDFFLFGEEFGAVGAFALVIVAFLRQVVWIDLLDFFDHYFADAAAGHFEDGQAAAFEFGGVAFAGDAAEAGEEEAGECFDAAFFGELPVHLGFEVAELDAAVEDESA